MVPYVLKSTQAQNDQRRKRIVLSKTLGVILIALGLIGLIWGGINYTTRETVVDIGPIHATRDQQHSLPLPPVVGAIVLLAGVVLVFTGKKG